MNTKLFILLMETIFIDYYFWIQGIIDYGFSFHMVMHKLNASIRFKFCFIYSRFKVKKWLNTVDICELIYTDIMNSVLLIVETIAFKMWMNASSNTKMRSHTKRYLFNVWNVRGISELFCVINPVSHNS